MILTTTQAVENKNITAHLGIVVGETIIGANFFKDFLASIRDFIGGRSGSYEKVLLKARETSMNELTEAAIRLNADAIVAIDFHYETIGKDGSMLMVAVTGTAVKFEDR
jgi:uncharacterized protein YbjQ (UPF0145 family)